jgi:hypothetical protein
MIGAPHNRSKIALRRYLIALTAAGALVVGVSAGCGGDEVTTTTPTAVTGPTGPTGEEGQSE